MTWRVAVRFFGLGVGWMCIGGGAFRLAGWPGLAGLALLFVVGLLAAWCRRERVETCGTDQEGVWALSEGSLYAVRWDRLCEIGIVTNDLGPAVEDLYWLFFGPNGEHCALPGSIGAEILERLSGLDGVDYEAVIRANGSVENASFRVWKGAPGAAAGCAMKPAS